MFERTVVNVGGKALEAWSEASLLSRVLTTTGCVLGAAWAWGICAMAGLPAMPGYDASLFFQPAPVIAIFAVAVVVLGATFLGSAVAGRVRFEAGLLSAAVALMVMSSWFGTMRVAVTSVASPMSLLNLAIETTLLFIFLLAGVALIRALRATGLVRPSDASQTRESSSSHNNLFATFTHVVVMIVLMQILMATDQKAQAIFSVGGSSLVAGIAAQWLFPTRRVFFLWIAPLIVAWIGYLFESISPSGSWQIGVISQPLARAIPLDYAGAGVAGAILAFWSTDESGEPSTSA